MLRRQAGKSREGGRLTETGRPAVVGFSGKSGSGKTTLIEKLIPRLSARGLRVAAVKHCPHHLEADRPGKDSDRMFRAGADVMAAGQQEAFVRIHAENLTLDQCLGRIGNASDVVLVEGYLETALPRIHVASPEEPEPRAETGELLLAVNDLEKDLEAVERAVWSVIERA